MRCPYCQSLENRVMDSRFREDGNVVRRRRKCMKCKRRFTTYERVGDMHPLVIKKDGRREAFDRSKIQAGVHRACEKRPVSVEQMESLVDQIELQICDMGEREVDSKKIGDVVMRKLRDLDKVAYVRFASVYREFADPEDFMDELRKLVKEPAAAKAKTRNNKTPRRRTLDA
ncbi:transcriptional regulator NrdR [bacterium]|nr:transcriptional regulator NrdR [bacterium]